MNAVVVGVVIGFVVGAVVGVVGALLLLLLSQSFFWSAQPRVSRSAQPQSLP